jgi:Secretion system C-terminal sorting domain
MQHLYPAQKIKFIDSLKYLALASVLLISFQYSFSQHSSGDLVSFTAQSNDSNKIMLSLVSGSEINTSHFIIQKSADGISFEDVALIFSEEENMNIVPRYYFYTDKRGVEQDAGVYYRVKTVSVKGEAAFSDTISIKPEAVKSAIQVRANSAQSEIKITNPAQWLGETVHYSLYDMHAGLVRQKIADKAQKTETINIADLPTGKYIIKAEYGRYSSAQKIVKLSS